MDKLDDAIEKLQREKKTGFRVVKPDPVPEGSPDAGTPEIDTARSDQRVGREKRSSAFDAVSEAARKHFGASHADERSNGPVEAAEDEGDSEMVSFRPEGGLRTDQPADAKVKVYSRSKKKVILTQG